MHFYSKRIKFLILLVIVIGLTAPVISAHANTGNNVNEAVVQSYGADSSVLSSMIVEVKPKDKASVMPLNSRDINNMLGVIVPAGDAAISLTPQTVSTQQVLVASSGRYSLLVSTQNGAIKSGDYLTMSSLPGIGMKADATQSLVVGRAVSSLNGTNNIGVVSLKNSQGKSSSVSIGRISADIQLAPNPLHLKNSSVLALLTRAEFDVTSKTVSPIRTYLSGLIFLATTTTTIVVLFSGTRAAIIASGRNPLARSIIGRSLLKTVVVGLLVFAAGTAAVYLILNR